MQTVKTNMKWRVLNKKTKYLQLLSKMSKHICPILGDGSLCPGPSVEQSGDKKIK